MNHINKSVAFIIFSFLVAGNTFGKDLSARKIKSTDIFDVMLTGMNVKKEIVKKNLIGLSESNESDVLEFLKYFPIKPTKKIANGFSFKKKYQYIQPRFDKNFIAFSLGNENNKWKGKLYRISFNVKYPDSNFFEEKTTVFKELNKMYGKYTKKQKYQLQRKNNGYDMNYYIWELPNISITYRTVNKNNSPSKNSPQVVVEYWDSEFYNSHKYYNGY